MNSLKVFKFESYLSYGPEHPATSSRIRQHQHTEVGNRGHIQASEGLS